MGFRTSSTLLFLLAACAATEPGLKDQAPVPVGPLVVPKPVAVPAPVGLSPPAPFLVVPEEQGGKPRAEAQESPDAAGTAPDVKPPSQQEPGVHPRSAQDKGPPPAMTSERRPECQPVPTPHRGGDTLHDGCADDFPPNRFPGHDVLVNGKRFDALQAGTDVLWEIKTDRFGSYTPYLQTQVLINQVPELRRERDIATECGYGFIVGVSSAAHQDALLRQAPELKVVLTGC